MEKKQRSLDAAPTAASIISILVITAFAIAAVFIFADISLGASNRSSNRSDTTPGDVYVQNQAAAFRLAANERENGSSDNSESHEDESVLQRNLERWQSMPSDQKETLRNRMNQWQDLSPQEQNTYRKRYQQLQQLPPGQRNKIKQDIENWDSLSKDEKEAIQDLFKNQ